MIVEFAADKYLGLQEGDLERLSEVEKVALLFDDLQDTGSLCNIHAKMQTSLDPEQRALDLILFEFLLLAVTDHLLYLHEGVVVHTLLQEHLDSDHPPFQQLLLHKAVLLAEFSLFLGFPMAPTECTPLQTHPAESSPHFDDIERRKSFFLHLPESIQLFLQETWLSTTAVTQDLLDMLVDVGESLELVVEF